MRDTLIAEIAELQVQIDGYAAQLEQAYFGTAKYDAIESELEKVKAKLTAKREALAEIDGAKETAQIEVIELFDTLTVPGTDDAIPLAYLLTTDLIPLEDKMSIITSALQNKLANAAIVKASLEAEKGRMQSRIESLVEENCFLIKRNDELDLKAADFESKLHNAGVQIEELKAENIRKDADISKLRDQLTNSNHASTTKVEVESMVEALAKRPAIYNVRWEQEVGFRTHKLANLAETGEEIRFHYFNEGIYRTINEEELLQFRKEKEDRDLQAADEAAKLAEEALANSALVVPTLPSEAKSDGLVEEYASVEVAGQTVSRQEFEDLAARVARIEQSAVAVA